MAFVPRTQDATPGIGCIVVGIQMQDVDAEAWIGCRSLDWDAAAGIGFTCEDSGSGIQPRY